MDIEDILENNLNNNEIINQCEKVAVFQQTDFHDRVFMIQFPEHDDDERQRRRDSKQRDEI